MNRNQKRKVTRSHVHAPFSTKKKNSFCTNFPKAGLRETDIPTQVGKKHRGTTVRSKKYSQELVTVVYVHLILDLVFCAVGTLLVRGQGGTRGVKRG